MDLILFQSPYGVGGGCTGAFFYGSLAAMFQSPGGQCEQLKNVGNDPCVIPNRNSSVTYIGTTQGLFPTIVKTKFYEFLMLALFIAGWGLYKCN